MSGPTPSEVYAKSKLPSAEPKPDNTEIVVIVAAASIVMVGLFSIVLIVVLRPDVDITSVVVPILGAVIAFAGTLIAILRVSSVKKDVQELAVTVDGRLSQLLETSVAEASAKATGIAQQVAAAEAAKVAAKAIKDAQDTAVALAASAVLPPGSAVIALAPSPVPVEISPDQTIATIVPAKLSTPDTSDSTTDPGKSLEGGAKE